MSLNRDVKTCSKLLLEYTTQKSLPQGERLSFAGVDGNDVYNITAPFEDDGEMIIAGRVEHRDSEYSEVVFFKCENGTWIPKENAKRYKLQDPFCTKISGELIFGGVEVWPYPENPEMLNWRTVFYRGTNIDSLKQFAVGPDHMKDIRLVGLDDGRIGVFTRPQGEIGGRGQIGFVIIDSLDKLNTTVIVKANLITNQFVEAEWGGANEPHLLKNGLIGVLGHIACFDEQGNRHYYSMAFSYNPKSGEASPIKMIAARMDFESGAAKRPDLVDVIFSGGLKRLGDGKAVLYAGVSDAEAHKIDIPDPFLEYEQ